MRWLILFPLAALGAAPAPDERSFMVSGFERLRVEGPFDVRVAPGSPRAIASGSGKALDQVSIRMEGRTMIVSAGPMGWETRGGASIVAPDVRVTVPSLRSVMVRGGGTVHLAEMEGAQVDASLSGGGAIEIGAVKADIVNATLTGAGKIAIAGNALRGRLRSYGAGSIDAAGLTLGDAAIQSQSSGDIAVAVRYTAQIVALGTGAVRITGKPECTVSGPGPVECAGTVIRR